MYVVVVQAGHQSAVVCIDDPIAGLRRQLMADLNHSAVFAAHGLPGRLEQRRIAGVYNVQGGRGLRLLHELSVPRGPRLRVTLATRYIRGSENAITVAIVQYSADDFLEHMRLTPAEWSAVAQPAVPLVVVDLKEVTPEQARLSSPSMPACVVVGVNSDLVETDQPNFVDLIASSAGELAMIHERVEANPLAAVVLVQLLRQTLELSVGQALFAESLAYSTLQHGAEFERFSESHVRRTPLANSEPVVLVERHEDKLNLILNRPTRHNAYSAAMRDALCEALQVARVDETITKIQLSGAGASFCAGGDLDEFGLARDAAVAHLSRSSLSAGALLHELAAKVAVDVQGACVGAGIELPAFAGRLSAAPDAVFKLPEVSLGLVPGAGGTVSLPRRIGCHRTALLALTGDSIDATTALSWGLIDDIKSEETKNPRT